jgi:hypothetical protein
MQALFTYLSRFSLVSRFPHPSSVLFNLQILVILIFNHEASNLLVNSFAVGGGTKDGFWYGDVNIVFGYIKGSSICGLRFLVNSLVSGEDIKGGLCPREFISILGYLVSGLGLSFGLSPFITINLVHLVNYRWLNVD